MGGFSLLGCLEDKGDEGGCFSLAMLGANSIVQHSALVMHDVGTVKINTAHLVIGLRLSGVDWANSMVGPGIPQRV